VLLERGLALAVRGLSAFHPGAAAAVAERAFFTPPRPRRSRGEALMRGGEPFQASVEGRRIAAWRFGRGPTVVLLHGWGGRAAHLASFVAPLTRRGFSVVALDAPGHGASARGRSSAPDFARALRAVSAPSGVHAVVGHSLGAAAVALALRDGLRASRVVFLAPPAYPPGWFEVFERRLGLRPEVASRVRARSERRLRLAWPELHVPSLAAAFHQPLLVLHDRHDPDVPLADGRAIAAAWRGARLVETEGLGHNALLRDPAAVSQVVEFLAEGRQDRCACGAPVGDDACERCALERELYDRDRRFTSAEPPLA
jgi:pimeloyl-ACP methyl ester carboxylesterase